MSELTREMIRQHCLVLRDALGNLFPSIDDPSREYYWELLDELGKAALSALTARSEGFRELEAEIVQAAVDAYKGEYQVDVHIHLANLTRRYIDLSALSPRETDAKTEADRQIAIGLEYLRKKVQDEPTSAPSGEVAEMVKRLRECLSEHNRIRIAFLHNLERSVKPLEYETERQAFEALNNAAALLSKAGQGWVPIGEAPRQVAWIDNDARYVGIIIGQSRYLLELPPPPERP